ncbi:CDT1-like protein a, chloroplastic isoform X2 [Magnolia sinica]|uniref:CDT1-like protein a, chloroplastic isoform X2 n=1 Tax=Magnolia sinica TaxID=86752 RepID=UPI00265A16AE|nr:CDT1-like protein a, chloroplastic isoform X2 [Magnolia sinica]
MARIFPSGRYEMLGEFFDCLESSIRLVRLKRSMSTFANICPKIESLTDRRFSHCHLAQLKYILPEVISIKKILVHDERTLCMKPELQITLQLDAFENGGNRKSGSGYAFLRKMFRARLLDFCNAHPEGDEVPQETLPEPFNKTKPSMLPNATAPGGPQLPPPSFETLPQRPSHMSQSFKRRFSQKIPIPKSEKTQLEHSADPLKPITSFSSPCTNKQLSDKEAPIPVNQSPFRCSSKLPTSKKSLTFGSSHVQIPPSSPCEIHKERITMKKGDYDSQTAADGITGTPAKLISTPLKLTTATPELQSPKRCRLSPCSPYNASTSLNKSARRPIPSRSLEFNTPTKNTELEDEKNDVGTSEVDDILKFLPETLLQSLREKERKAMEEKNAGVPEAKRRQQMIACLPKLFDMIHLIFQSMRRSVLTKQELMHKIITNNCDIVDRREVEEQLKLLQELVPDWISGKMSSSGDFLFCVNKISSPESIHARLAEAE